jgi:uncharacterized protein (TIGR02246 family)
MVSKASWISPERLSPARIEDCSCDPVCHEEHTPGIDSNRFEKSRDGVEPTGARREQTSGWKDDQMTRYGHTLSETDLEAIDRVRETHVNAVNAGDAETWAGLFTDDGVQMPPHAPANIGRTAIAGWSEGFMGLFHLEFTLAVDEVHIQEEWAFERGTYAITLNPKAGGPPMQDAGKYITVYQRKPGDSWQMARDIWNSNTPLPAPQAR